MVDLSKMSDSAKVLFLMEALLDAAHALNKHNPDAAARYIGYVLEMMPAAQVKEPSP